MIRIFMLAVLLAAGYFFGCTVQTRADDNAIMDNQIINDEGYGNSDTEYYGSEDDLINDEQENIESNVQD